MRPRGLCVFCARGIAPRTDFVSLSGQRAMGIELARENASVGEIQVSFGVWLPVRIIR